MAAPRIRKQDRQAARNVYEAEDCSDADEYWTEGAKRPNKTREERQAKRKVALARKAETARLLECEQAIISSAAELPKPSEFVRMPE